MDLSSPIRSVVPGARGEVLAVLARTTQPLSGRRVAELTDGRVSQKGANLALRALVSSGVVLSEDQPPAKLYRLNRDHLAAPSIEGLATLRERLVAAMRSHLAGWEVPAWGAWLFGSAARGDGGEDSDVDLLVVRSDDVDEDDARWLDQVEGLVADVTAWTGNRCSVVEYGADEFERLMAGRGRLAASLRSDALNLTDRRLPNRAVTGRTRR
jgi:hypothetical protein